MLEPHGRPNLPPRKRETRRLCKCTSYCATLNPSTGRYEGGSWIARATRQRHMEEERYRRVHEKFKLSKAKPPTFRVATMEDRIKIVLAEFSWLRTLPVTSATTQLCFQHNPTQPISSEPDRLILNEESSANMSFLYIESRYKTLLEQLHGMLPSDYQDEAAGQVMDGLDELYKIRSDHWDQQSGHPGANALVCNTDRHFKHRGSYHRVVRAAHILLLVLQNIHFIPRRALRIHLRGVRGVLQSANISRDILEAIPLDPRTCAKAYDIEPVVRVYLACPECHCLYRYEYDQDPGRLPRCLYRQTPASPVCGAALWKERQVTGTISAHMPLRKYHHQDLKSWIGRLLSRPGMEDLIDQPYSTVDTSGNRVHDIWGSKVLTEFSGPNGQTFFPSTDDSCRLVFGFAGDGFLPFTAKTQSVSSTGLWLVLYNLPPNLRYLPQNVFLAGVIPGPNKPSKDQLNHYTQLIVNDFKELWDPGVFFTRTHKYRLGRLCLAILILVLGDHPGLRQIIGYAGANTAHNICTGCDIDIDDIHILDKTQWPLKDAHAIRTHAVAWKDAPNESAQKAVFEAYEWRWSPLFKLPYWDPVLLSVVDTMHALDLNVFKNHCRSLFGIDVDHVGGDRSSALLNPVAYGATTLDSEDLGLRKCKCILKANGPALLDQLLEFEQPVLYNICTLYNVVDQGKDQVIGARHVLARNLHAWRQELDENFFMDDSSQTDESLVDGAPSGASKKELSLKYQIIRKLLSEDEHEQDSARTQSNFILHGELCQLLDLPTSDGDTKASRHTALISALSSHRSKRQILIEVLPQKQLARLGAQSSNNSTSQDGRDHRESSEPAPSDVGTPQPGNSSTTQDGQAAALSSQELLEIVERSSDPKAVKRLLRHIHAILPEGIDAAAPMTLSTVKVQIYEEVSDILNVEIGGSGGRGKKEHINRAILSLLESDDEKYELLAVFSPRNERDFVLDKHVMQKVWQDMRRTLLPSWVKSAPPNWDTAKRGTLSANNWQVICTIHLPITLIWLWRDETGRKKDLLVNFMHLVTASSLAYMRATTPEQISAFEHHMTSYIAGIKALYPGHQLKPTHHTSMHIGDMMRSFGPDHCRNARFYERYILFLHRIGTNSKLGEMEKTFLEFAAQNSNLCAILSDDEQLQGDMMDMIQGIQSLKEEDLRGFEMASILDPTRARFNANDNPSPTELQGTIAAELLDLQQSIGLQPCSRETFHVSQVAQGGVRYADHQSRRFRDSTIIFQSRKPVRSKRCGFIQLIFRQLCTRGNGKESHEIFVVVDEHKPISERGIPDPYTAYGFAAGYLCDRNPSERHVICLSDVISHFASTPIEGTDYLHVMPVDRMMYHANVEEDES